MSKIYIKRNINVDKSQHFKIKRYSLYHTRDSAENELRNLSYYIKRTKIKGDILMKEKY